MNRDFKGIWIPKEVWLSKDLTVIEKLFFVEIDSLDNELGCFASNAYFAEFFDISKGRCTQIIKGLEAKNLVTIEHERKGKQIVKRLIRVVNKLNNPIKNIKQPYLENDEDNNTILNNTNIIERTSIEIDAEHVADYLAYHILIKNHSAKVNVKSWIKDIEKTIRIDGRTRKQLTDCIDWIHTGKGSFWIPNILSGKKLREKFDTMNMQVISDPMNQSRSVTQQVWEAREEKKRRANAN